MAALNKGTHRSQNLNFESVLINKKKQIKIGLFANTDWYLYGFRSELVKRLAKANFQVTLLSPGGEYSSRLSKGKIQWLPVKLSRKGANPVRELGSLFRLVAIYRNHRFDIVHHFTIKCVIYGSIAAKLTGTKNIVNSITGLGHVFLATSFPMRIIKAIVLFLYRYTLNGTLVVFQNQDDKDLFIKKGIISAKQAVVVQGSGVNIKVFSYKPEPKPALPLVILPGRLLWEKGVQEFVQAARIINRDKKRARFLLVGEPDKGNPSSVPPKTIAEWKRKGIIEWRGWITEMPKVYHSANIICLPSYREGLSKTLVEAAACGRAIATTDIPGCRDVVENGVSGILVPVKDSNALAKAIDFLLHNPALRKKMGKRGRQRAVEYFSSETVNSKTLQVYESLLKRNV